MVERGVHRLPSVLNLSLPDLAEHLAVAAWCGSSGFCIVDKGGRVLAANEHLCRLLNYSETEIVGLHFNDFTLAKDQGADAREFAALIAGEKDYYYMDKTWVGKLNTPVSGHLFVMRFESGEVIFAISQIIEGLSPEQVGAFAVMVRSLMEDWLLTQGLKMSRKPESTSEVLPWYRQPIVWAAIGSAGAAWPIISGLISLFHRIADVLYPAGP